MTLKIYNTLSQKKEEFTLPRGASEVKIYTCGPTVYDRAHIGNLRSFVSADILVRTLTFLGFSVRQVMNITDIDDKTIAGSQKAGVDLERFTAPFTEIFLNDLVQLNITKPTYNPKATEYIPAMIEFVDLLIKKGFAYVAKDGVYFSISKLPDYGCLAGLKEVSGNDARISQDEYDKDNPGDFVLWKNRTAADGDNYWSSPWGDGRPGWHLECSVMATNLLGPTIDIHTGGIDLVFPHHTNEIAQAESATGESPFSRFWFHTAFVNIDNSKISKSLGNTIDLKELGDKGKDPLAYRYWLLMTHYRQPSNFTYQAIDGAESALRRLVQKLSALPDPDQNTGLPENYLRSFVDLISDDLNTPKALALGWDLLTDKNISGDSKKAAWLEFDRVFGLNLSQKINSGSSFEIEFDRLPAEVQAMFWQREEARKEKKWAQADDLRDRLKELGWEVLDTPEGPKIRRSE